ncbi:cytoplasmic tRNA thiolation protein [Salix suchowensis]|nr:cytoplasmic tRNA thiolation protein [Salix suchowensis]
MPNEPASEGDNLTLHKSSRAKKKPLDFNTMKTALILLGLKFPLHYPRYAKKDQQNMPAGKLDRIIAEYGLPVRSDSACKREFAIGAF